MQSKANIYFKEVAHQWDEMRRGYFPDSLRDEMISKGFLLSEMEVADIGAGSGFLSTELVNKVSMVHLVDTSDEMLAQAKKNLSAYTNTQFHLAEGCEIPLAQNSQDAVFANMYLHHAPDPFVAIKEMARILKPGCRLVISDLVEHNHTWLPEEMADEWPGFDQNQIMEWFQQSGLVNSYINCHGTNCSGKSQADDSQSAETSIFIAVGTKRVQRKESVKENYSLIAESGCGCGCSPQTDQSKLLTQQACCPPSNTSETALSIERTPNHSAGSRRYLFGMWQPASDGIPSTRRYCRGYWLWRRYRCVSGCQSCRKERACNRD